MVASSSDQTILSTTPRTWPAVSAIGFSKLLISDAETLPRDMIKEFASHVHSSTTNTYDLLENLLTWTRMQTGRMYYQRAWHGVSELIKNNITMLKDNAARKSIVLKQEINGDAQLITGSKMVGDEECHEMRIIYSGGRGEAVWWFSKRDFLPRGVQRILVSPSGKRAIQQWLITDLLVDPELSEETFLFPVPEGYTKTNRPAP